MTAELVRVALAPPLDSYAPLAYTGETSRAIARVEPCACGTDVVQYIGEPVPDAVIRHVRDADHAAWAAIVSAEWT